MRYVFPAALLFIFVFGVLFALSGVQLQTTRGLYTFHNGTQPTSHVSYTSDTHLHIRLRTIDARHGSVPFRDVAECVRFAHELSAGGLHVSELRGLRLFVRLHMQRLCTRERVRSIQHRALQHPDSVRELLIFRETGFFEVYELANKDIGVYFRSAGRTTRFRYGIPDPTTKRYTRLSVDIKDNLQLQGPWCSPICNLKTCWEDDSTFFSLEGEIQPSGSRSESGYTRRFTLFERVQFCPRELWQKSESSIQLLSVGCRQFARLTSEFLPEFVKNTGEKVYKFIRWGFGLFEPPIRLYRDLLASVIGSGFRQGLSIYDQDFSTLADYTQGSQIKRHTSTSNQASEQRDDASRNATGGDTTNGERDVHSVRTGGGFQFGFESANTTTSIGNSADEDSLVVFARILGCTGLVLAMVLFWVFLYRCIWGFVTSIDEWRARNAERIRIAWQQRLRAVTSYYNQDFGIHLPEVIVDNNLGKGMEVIQPKHSFRMLYRSKEDDEIILRTLGVANLVKIRGQAYMVMTAHQYKLLNDFISKDILVTAAGPNDSVVMNDYKFRLLLSTKADHSDLVLLNFPAAFQATVGLRPITVGDIPSQSFITKLIRFDVESKAWLSTFAITEVIDEKTKRPRLMHQHNTCNGDSGSLLMRVLDGGVLQAVGLHVGGDHGKRVNYASFLPWLRSLTLGNRVDDNEAENQAKESGYFYNPRADSLWADIEFADEIVFGEKGAYGRIGRPGSKTMMIMEADGSVHINPEWRSALEQVEEDIDEMFFVPRQDWDEETQPNKVIDPGAVERKSIPAVVETVVIPKLEEAYPSSRAFMETTTTQKHLVLAKPRYSGTIETSEVKKTYPPPRASMVVETKTIVKEVVVPQSFQSSPSGGGATKPLQKSELPQTSVLKTPSVSQKKKKKRAPRVFPSGESAVAGSSVKTPESSRKAILNYFNGLTSVQLETLQKLCEGSKVLAGQGGGVTRK